MVTLLYTRSTDVQSIFGSKHGVEESVTSVNCAGSICEVNNEQEEVWQDSDTQFRTPKVGLLP